MNVLYYYYLGKKPRILEKKIRKAFVKLSRSISSLFIKTMRNFNKLNLPKYVREIFI